MKAWEISNNDIEGCEVVFAETRGKAKSMVDENETHEVACYGCINYGTHHSDPKNKGTNLYDCEGCSCEGIGHDIVKWLAIEVDS